MIPHRTKCTEPDVYRDRVVVDSAAELAILRVSGFTSP
jgi:hypothetical protein